MLTINHLSKSFQNRIVLDSINLEVEPGERIFLIGPNGSGKSTLFKILAGLMEPTSGVYSTDYTISLSLQDIIYWNHLTLKEHYLYICKIWDEKLSSFEINLKIERILDLLSLEYYKDHHIKHLSGGYQRRFSIGLSLLMNPDFLLLDEPFNGLDYHSRIRLWEIIRRLTDEEDKSILVTGHELKEIEPNVDRFIFLKDGRLELDIQRPFLLERYDGSLESAYLDLYEDKMYV